MNAAWTDGLASPLAFGAIGAAFAFAACWRAVANYRLLREGAAATGTVLNIERRRDWGSEGNIRYNHFPEFEFKTPDGESHRVLSRTGTSPSEFVVGSTVAVRYFAGRPATARIQSTRQLWSKVWILGAIGVVLLALTLRKLL